MKAAAAFLFTWSFALAAAAAPAPVNITYGYHPYWTGGWYGVIIKTKDSGRNICRRAARSGSSRISPARR